MFVLWHHFLFFFFYGYAFSLPISAPSSRVCTQSFVCSHLTLIALCQEYAAAGTVKQNYVNILLMLLRLRQACDHPLLVKGCDYSSAWRSSVDTAKKLPREKQVFLLNCLEASLAICGICNVCAPFIFRFYLLLFYGSFIARAIVACALHNVISSVGHSVGCRRNLCRLQIAQLFGE